MFYERVTSLCEQNNDTITAVALKLGLSRSTPTSWKNGRVPSADAVLKLADYFNVSTDYLLGRTEDPRPISVIDDLQDQSLTDDERQAVKAYLGIYRQNKEK